MGGTAPKTDQVWACEERACVRSGNHRGKHVYRMCDKPGCTNRTRNAEEHRCVRHENRATYDRYNKAATSDAGEVYELHGCEPPCQHDQLMKILLSIDPLPERHG